MTSTKRSDRTVAETAALVVERHTALEHDGILIDAQTAHAITVVYNALSSKNRAKFDALRADRAGIVAWKLVSR